MADKRWYAVHTYSGFENKAKKSLEEKIRLEGLQDQFGEILIPMEQVVEMVKGEKKVSKRKVLPGYVLVQMEMNDRTWHLVKNTPKVTGFVGGAPHEQPPPMQDIEVKRLTAQISEGTLKPKPKVQFGEGQPRQGATEGAGFHLWPSDAGRARLHASREDCVLSPRFNGEPNS
jgi:transcriptional antiterminator NusG